MPGRQDADESASSNSQCSLTDFSLPNTLPSPQAISKFRKRFWIGLLGDSPRALFTDLIFSICGALLLIAAGLKCVEYLRLFQFTSSNSSSIIQIVYEVLLGSWLLFGPANRLLREVAIITFIGFSLFAFWYLVNGAEDCGCFGIIAVPPVLSLAIDIVFLGALIAVRPDPKTQRIDCVSWRGWQTAVGWKRWYFGCSSLCFALAIMLAVSHPWTREHAIANAASLLPNEIKVPRVSDEMASVDLKVVNNRSFSVDRIKVIASCGCTRSGVTSDRLRPGESATVQLFVEGPRSQEAFRIPILLEYYDGENVLSELSYLVSAAYSHGSMESTMRSIIR